MEIGFGIDDGATQRNAYGAAEIAHHVEKPACIFESIRRQARESEIDCRRDGKDLRQAAKDLRDQELISTPVMSDESVAPHRQAEGGKSQHHQPANVEFPCEDDVNWHA